MVVIFQETVVESLAARLDAVVLMAYLRHSINCGDEAVDLLFFLSPIYIWIDTKNMMSILSSCNGCAAIFSNVLIYTY